MSGWRKRQKPYLSQQNPLPKRLRRDEIAAPEERGREGKEEKPSKQSSVVIVSGLAPGCSVLELKSRFEMFGAVSRLRIDNSLGFAYVTFRSKDSAQDAISAALDPSSGIIIQSEKVQVSWANDPLPQWKAGVRASSGQDRRPSSKLLRPEIPLSRHGRDNRKLSAGKTTSPNTNGPDLPFKGREIIAYDDLLPLLPVVLRGSSVVTTEL
ncbi:uncharacterized protein At1g27050 [Magnolia sinica]|uniref:uncharacterized protein At1g27050 n=1 Tax=Magnolia sinica TaxID=86752 RepID=UPI002659F38A|nr:uncharacterized protein At1g27050 [Magnolia sinica]